MGRRLPPLRRGERVAIAAGDRAAGARADHGDPARGRRGGGDDDRGDAAQSRAAAAGADRRTRDPGGWRRGVLRRVDARVRTRRGRRTRRIGLRSEEHTSELQSLMRSSYAVFCLKKKKKEKNISIPS